MKRIHVIAIVTVLIGGFMFATGAGCSSGGEGITQRDFAAMAVIAGATGADASFQVQNRPGEVGTKTGVYLDTGVDVSANLKFNGSEVDQDTLFRLIDTLGDDPPDSDSGGLSFVDDSFILENQQCVLSTLNPMTRDPVGNGLSCIIHQRETNRNDMNPFVPKPLILLVC